MIEGYDSKDRNAIWAKDCSKDKDCGKERNKPTRSGQSKALLLEEEGGHEEESAALGRVVEGAIRLRGFEKIHPGKGHNLEISRL